MVVKNALVLIICLSSYFKSSNGAWRDLRGTKNDKTKLVDLFKNIYGYNVIYNEDDNEILTPSTFRTKYLRKARREINDYESDDSNSNTKYDAFIFVFAGHGIENSKIILNNGDEISVDFIKKWFDGNEDHVPSLIKQPKIFITDCCRSKSVKIPNRIKIEQKDNNDENRGKNTWHNPDKNIITMYGTTEGYSASDHGYLNKAIYDTLKPLLLASLFIEIFQIKLKSQNKMVSIKIPACKSSLCLKKK